jgi:hypothetical protein
MGRSGATWRLGGRVGVALAWNGVANGAVSTPAAEPLPDDVETLKAMLLAERQAHRTEVRDQALLIEKLEHQIARLRHERFGQSSERRALLDRLEQQLFVLKEDQAHAAMPIDEPPTQAVQPSRGASRRGGRCPSTCRASAWSIRCRRPARAAAAFCTSWART